MKTKKKLGCRFSAQCESANASLEKCITGNDEMNCYYKTHKRS